MLLQNMNMNLYFVMFPETEMAYIVQILSYGRQAPVYPIVDNINGHACDFVLPEYSRIYTK